MKMVNHFLVLVILVMTAETFEVENGKDVEDICTIVKCRAGRECKILDSGAATCICTIHCPDHHVPVCGSNGISYENHCLLHRDACLRHMHISIKHKGYCKNGPFYKNRQIIQKRKPVACFQQERDHMRHLIIKKFTYQHEQQTPASITYQELIKAKFNVCDGDSDGYLDSSEFLECAKQNQSLMQIRTGESSDLISTLCIDAIIESADKDSDWLLNFEEFKTFMDINFHPKKKLCSLDGKEYKDGSETLVDCNSCVCACGNWVCTSSTCVQHGNADNIKKN